MTSLAPLADGFGASAGGAFRPRTVRLRLPWRTRVAFWGCAAFAAVGLVLAAVEDVGGLLPALFFGGLALAGLWLPREVTFGPDALVVHRRWGRPLRIAYADVTGVGLGRLVARRSGGGRARFGWAPFENGHEVVRALGDLDAAGLLPPDVLDGDLLWRDLTAMRAQLFGLYGMAGAVVLLIALGLAGAGRSTPCAASTGAPAAAARCSATRPASVWTGSRRGPRWRRSSRAGRGRRAGGGRP